MQAQTAGPRRAPHPPGCCAAAPRTARARTGPRVATATPSARPGQWLQPPARGRPPRPARPPARGKERRARISQQPAQPVAGSRTQPRAWRASQRAAQAAAAPAPTPVHPRAHLPRHLHRPVLGAPHAQPRPQARLPRHRPATARAVWRRRRGGERHRARRRGLHGQREQRQRRVERQRVQVLRQVVDAWRGSRRGGGSEVWGPALAEHDCSSASSSAPTPTHVHALIHPHTWRGLEPLLRHAHLRVRVRLHQVANRQGWQVRGPPVHAWTGKAPCGMPIRSCCCSCSAAPLLAWHSLQPPSAAAPAPPQPASPAPAPPNPFLPPPPTPSPPRAHLRLMLLSPDTLTVTPGPSRTRRITPTSALRGK